jgi:hypothetical protein
MGYDDGLFLLLYIDIGIVELIRFDTFICILSFALVLGNKSIQFSCIFLSFALFVSVSSISLVNPLVLCHQRNARCVTTKPCSPPRTILPVVSPAYTNEVTVPLHKAQNSLTTTTVCLLPLNPSNLAKNILFALSSTLLDGKLGSTKACSRCTFASAG